MRERTELGGRSLPVLRALIKILVAKAEGGDFTAGDILKYVQDYTEPAEDLGANIKPGYLVVPEVCKDMDEWSKLYGPDAKDVKRFAAITAP